MFAFYNVLKKDQIMEDVIKNSNRLTSENIRVYFVFSFVNCGGLG